MRVWDYLMVGFFSFHSASSVKVLKQCIGERTCIANRRIVTPLLTSSTLSPSSLSVTTLSKQERRQQFEAQVHWCKHFFSETILPNLQLKYSVTGLLPDKYLWVSSKLLGIPYQHQEQWGTIRFSIHTVVFQVVMPTGITRMFADAWNGFSTSVFFWKTYLPPVEV